MVESISLWHPRTHLLFSTNIDPIYRAVVVLQQLKAPAAPAFPIPPAWPGRGASAAPFRPSGPDDRGTGRRPSDPPGRPGSRF